MTRTLALVATLSLGALCHAAPVLAKAPVAAPAAATTATAGAQDRFVAVEGGRNFRDAGGYRTADGHVVKRGALYRSGSLGSVTPQGAAAVNALKVAAMIDLRSTDERSHDTVDLKTAFPGYWSRDYGMSMGDMKSLFSDPSKLTADSMRTMMATAYRSMPKEQAVSYRELFARLADGKGAVVVNCTAGKDRTGIATALVLTALGVPYETIREDFLLSNGAPGMDTLQSSLSSSHFSLPAEVAAPLIGVEGVYLDNAFDQMRKDYGSVEGFLDKEVGVGPQQIAALRRQMLVD